MQIFCYNIRYTHTYAHIYTHTHIYTYTCTQTMHYIYVHMYTHTPTYTYTHTYVHVYIHIYVCICMYVHIYIYMYVCMYVCIYRERDTHACAYVADWWIFLTVVYLQSGLTLSSDGILATLNADLPAEGLDLTNIAPADEYWIHISHLLP